MIGKNWFPKLFSVVYAVLLLGLYMPQLFGLSGDSFAGVQGLWSDFLFQSQSESLKPGDPRLILLAVDEETGKKYGFPLPRAAYARALGQMKSLGVDTVIFDVLFFEPRSGDAELAAATRSFGRVVHLFTFPDFFAEGSPSLPVPPLLKAGRYFGSPNIEYMRARDGHVRIYQLFRPGVRDPIGGGDEAPSVAAAALAAYQGKTLDEVRARYGDKQRVFNLRRPVDWARHEAGSDRSAPPIRTPYRRISFRDLMDGALSPGQRQALKGSIVIVGSTALGYYDKFPNAFSDDSPGAELHLNAIDNSLNGDAMSSPYRAWTLLGILAAILLTYGLQKLPASTGAVLAAASFLGWICFTLWMFHRRVILEFVPPAFAFISSYLVLVVRRAWIDGDEKRQIKRLFGQFVAPEIVADLAADPAKVKLGGEKRELTIFFLDIAHFTAISEKMEPEELIQFLNRYLSALSDVVLERRGTIDKYIGDCIMAFWNAPLENKDHRADAILAALECQRMIGELNKTSKGLPEIPAARIGINSGPATVGLTGTQKKLQYTVIGDEVNLASRLEGANKFFGSKIMVSEATYAGARDRVAARFLGRARVVGKETPIVVYEPLGEKGRLSAEWTKALPLYEKGLAAFEARRYDDALKTFEEVLKIIPQDGPAALYRSLSRDYAALPPDASWDGVFNLTAK
ncbi:MAG: CHASE2 domain-containing protein [Elusimicrobia bacterium]|nr:CHASE2 domain-containing protein [Elusimicrobiota bacterium]